MTIATGTRRAGTRLLLWAAMPLVILLVAGALAASGMRLSQPAMGGSSDSVTVTATAAAALSVTPGCGASIGWTISLGTISYSPTCTIDYGASNDPTVYLQVRDTNGAPFQGTIADTASACAPLAAATDEAGVKITAVANNSSIVTASWGAACDPPTVAGVNDDFRAMPGAYLNACQSATTSVTNHQCTFQWAVREQGNDLAPGVHSGDAEFLAVDF